MPRIPFADPAVLTPEFQKLLAVKHPLNLYRMLPRLGPTASSGFVALGGAMLRDGRLDPVLREVAILRVGHISNASYEVHQHTRIGRKAGMTDALLSAVKEGADATGLTPQEALVIRYTDDVVANVKAGDALFGEVVKTFGEDQAAELTMVIGFYMMVCRFLENMEIPIETA